MSASITPFPGAAKAPPPPVVAPISSWPHVSVSMHNGLPTLFYQREANTEPLYAGPSIDIPLGPQQLLATLDEGDESLLFFIRVSDSHVVMHNVNRGKYVSIAMPLDAPSEPHHLPGRVFPINASGGLYLVAFHGGGFATIRRHRSGDARPITWGTDIVTDVWHHLWDDDTCAAFSTADAPDQRELVCMVGCAVEVTNVTGVVAVAPWASSAGEECYCVILEDKEDEGYYHLCVVPRHGLLDNDSELYQVAKLLNCTTAPTLRAVPGHQSVIVNVVQAEGAAATPFLFRGWDADGKALLEEHLSPEE